MPTLENRLPDTSNRALTRRAARSEAVIRIARGTLPGQMVLRTRRAAEAMGELAIDQRQAPEVRVSALRAMLASHDQLLDLIGWTKRPAAASGGKRPTAPTLDVSPIQPPADLD